MSRSNETTLYKFNDIFMLDVGSFDRLMSVLADGGLILLPTDTIWGICCDATNPDAVRKVYELKQRPKDNPLVCLVDGVPMLKDYVEHVHPRIETLLEFHTRPLTVIYDQGKKLAPNLLGPSGSVGIRVVREAFCRMIIEHFGKPLVASSANVSGLPFPRNFGEISSDILSGVDFVARYRQSEKDLNEPSVIVKLQEDEELLFLRE